MIADTDIVRFIKAQENIYPQVVKELRQGRKTSHWMWFIFPQIKDLGFSDTSKYYAIKSIKEAKEYLLHPVLGKRLQECCEILIEIKNKTASDIFGYPDDVKFLSSLTLFSYVSPEEKVYADLLKKYFKDKRDEKTLGILQSMIIK